MSDPVQPLEGQLSLAGGRFAGIDERGLGTGELGHAALLRCVTEMVAEQPPEVYEDLEVDEAARQLIETLRARREIAVQVPGAHRAFTVDVDRTAGASDEPPAHPFDPHPTMVTARDVAAGLPTDALGVAWDGGLRQCDTHAIQAAEEGRLKPTLQGQVIYPDPDDWARPVIACVDCQRELGLS